MYKGYIGAGKTWCVTTAVIEWIQQNKGKRVVYVVPFRNLSLEQTMNLRAAATKGSNKPRIHFYREGVQPTVDAATWDILVVCPMSMYKFNFADVGLVVIDELSAVNNQLVGWLDEDERVSMRLGQAIDIIKCILQNPQCTILLCGAQATTFEQERMLALIDIDPSVDMLRYEHSEAGPVTPIARLDSLAHAINFMWHYFIQGERVAIHFRHASDVRDAARYTAAKALECKVTAPRFLEWTQQSLAEYKGDPHPAENVTMYLQATEPQIMAYTTALNPGMSVNEDLFDRRIMVEPDTGDGAGSKVIGQMPGRMRKMKDGTILLYAPDQRRDNSTDGKTTEQRVMAKLVKLPGVGIETVLRADGKPECVLQPGLRNSLKLQAAVDAAKGISFDGIRAHIGNTYLIPTPTVVSSEPDPLWLKIRNERGQDLDNPIKHYNNDELVWMRVHTNSSLVPTLDKAQRVIFIARMLPRRFVTAGPEWISSNCLSNRAFNLIDTHYSQFMAMQLLVWTMSKANKFIPINRMTLLRAQTATICNKTVVDITADADLTVLVIAHVCTLVSLMPASDMTMQVYKPDPHASIQAHVWLTANWQRVKTFSSRGAKLPSTPPNRSDAKGWTRCLKRVFKSQLGVGVRKQKMHKNTESPHYSLTTGSLWKTLGLDLLAYTKWLLEGEAARITVSPIACVPCDLCDLDGQGPVECVFQGGFSRCATKSSLDCEMHRDLTAPLDVGTDAEFAVLIAKRNSTDKVSQCVPSPHDDTTVVSAPVFTLMDQQSEVKEQHMEAKIDPEVVDRLLKFLGFVDGVATASPVSVENVLAAVADNEALSEADQTHVQQKLALSMGTVTQWDNARQITLALCRLATNADLHITNERVKKQSTRSRAYTIIQT
jgi:hypothetical protein